MYERRFRNQVAVAAGMVAILVQVVGCSADPAGSTGSGGSNVSSGGATSSGGLASSAGNVGKGGASSSAGSLNGGGTSSGGGSVASGGSQGAGGGVIVDGTCYPLCASASSDPDGDGWGWENEASCVVMISPVAMGRMPCGGGSGGSSTGGSSGSGNGGSSAIDCSNVGGGTCPADSSYSCPPGFAQVGQGCDCAVEPGWGARKCAIVLAGGLDMLASAMMETGGNMDLDANNYPYGDEYPDGTPKTGDAFNAGVCKQNWGMIRACYAPWSNLGQDQYDTAAAMNDDLILDGTVYGACRQHFGDLWWAGHRNGAAGLDNPNTQDIQNFKAAYEWTRARLIGHEQDDLYFWISVPAIK